MWRKQSGLSRIHHDEAYWQSSLLAQYFAGDRLVSKSSTQVEPSSFVTVRRELQVESKGGKRVGFESTALVILIPQRVEYVSAGLSSSVWWSRASYYNFIIEAREEVNDYVIKNSSTTKEAVRALYQPEEELEQVEVKSIGSPTSVVPRYSEYRQLIEAHMMTSKEEEVERTASTDSESTLVEVSKHRFSFPACGCDSTFATAATGDRPCSVGDGIGLCAADG